MLIYHCHPLSAWISLQACKCNADLGAHARSAPEGSNRWGAGYPYREKCERCPGVLVLSRLNGHPPREVPDVREKPEKKSRRRYNRISSNIGTSIKPEPRSWGARVHAARRQRGLTQGELALLLGCTRTHVAMLERGRDRPQPGIVQHVQTVLGVSP